MQNFTSIKNVAPKLASICFTKKVCLLCEYWIRYSLWHVSHVLFRPALLEVLCCYAYLLKKISSVDNFFSAMCTLPVSSLTKSRCSKCESFSGAIKTNSSGASGGNTQYKTGTPPPSWVYKCRSNMNTIKSSYSGRNFHKYECNKYMFKFVKSRKEHS